MCIRKIHTRVIFAHMLLLRSKLKEALSFLKKEKEGDGELIQRKILKKQ